MINSASKNPPPCLKFYLYNISVIILKMLKSAAKSVFFVILAILITPVVSLLTSSSTRQLPPTISNIPSIKSATSAQETLGISTKPISPSPEYNFNRVTKIIDGDTFELETGQKVRLIGINTPETKDPRKEIQCFGNQAEKETQKILIGKIIKLEKDISETDRYGRLLRYVYVDGLFINKYLVENGFAYSISYPPDIKYQKILSQSESLARKQGRGLWSNCPLNSKALYPTSTQTQSIPQNPQNFICNCQKSCAQMLSCQEAQYQLNTCNCQARDGDHDNIACNGKPLYCTK